MKILIPFIILVALVTGINISGKLKDYPPTPVTYKTECQFKNIWNQTPLGQCICYPSGFCSWVWCGTDYSKRSK